MPDSLNRRLHRRYALFALSFVALVVTLGLAEQRGLPKAWIGYTFLGATVLVYPTDRAAYSRLCRLLSIGKSRAGNAPPSSASHRATNSRISCK